MKTYFEKVRAYPVSSNGGSGYAKYWERKCHTNPQPVAFSPGRSHWRIEIWSRFQESRALLACMREQTRLLRLQQLARMRTDTRIRTRFQSTMATNTNYTLFVHQSAGLNATGSITYQSCRPLPVDLYDISVSTIRMKTPFVIYYWFELTLSFLPPLSLLKKPFFALLGVGD